MKLSLKKHSIFVSPVPEKNGSRICIEPKKKDPTILHQYQDVVVGQREYPLPVGLHRKDIKRVWIENV